MKAESASSPMYNSFHQQIDDALNERVDKNIFREVPLYDASLINFANNDYLNLAHSKELKHAAQKAIEQYGCSSSASPLLSGYTQAHEDLLSKLKYWYGIQHGLLWNTGYAANQAILATLPRNGDMIIADKLIHNSLITGSKHSGARMLRYRHLDIDQLESKLQEHPDKTCFVVTESLFSMDGDYPDLTAIAALKSKYGFIWVLDEAHAIGWYGKKGSGLAEHFSVIQHVDILVGTLGKALGSMGAFTLFSDERIGKYLSNFSGEFIYSTYLAPVCAATATEAINMIERTDRSLGHATALDIRKRLHEIGYCVTEGESPIISIQVNDEEETLYLRDQLLSENILVAAIRPPTVPKGTSRIRLSIKNTIDKEVSHRLINAFKEATQ